MFSVFGLCFLLYYLKLSSGSGFWTKKTIPQEVLKFSQTSLNQDGKQTLKPIRSKEQLAKKHDGSAHRKTNPKKVSKSCQRSQNQDEKQLPNTFHVGDIGGLPLIDIQSVTLPDLIKLSNKKHDIECTDSKFFKGKTARKHIVPPFGRQQKSFSASKESQTNTVQTRIPANRRTCPQKMPKSCGIRVHDEYQLPNSVIACDARRLPFFDISNLPLNQSRNENQSTNQQIQLEQPLASHRELEQRQGDTMRGVFGNDQ